MGLWFESESHVARTTRDLQPNRTGRRAKEGRFVMLRFFLNLALSDSFYIQIIIRQKIFRKGRVSVGFHAQNFHIGVYINRKRCEKAKHMNNFL